MLKTINSTGSSTISPSSIDATDKDEIDESIYNKTNLSNSSISKRSTRVSYLTFRGAKKGGYNPKRGGSNIKNYIKAARSSFYLILDPKNVFNHLRHMFIQAPIFQYFDSEQFIQIETNAWGYSINGILTQLILNNLSQ